MAGENVYLVRLWILVAGIGLWTGCGAPEPEGGLGAGSDPARIATQAPTPGAGVRFLDFTASSGIDFAHVSGDAEQRYIVETMGGGAAFLDYDGDGYLDLYLVNGTRRDAPPTEAISRLYRNRANGAGRRIFADVTEAAGVGGRGWGMGCTTADYDNDGDVDVYVTYWGSNRLYRNRGDGGFDEVAKMAGVADPGWGASAGFGDLDADGWLDLYVTNYLEFDLAAPPNEGRPCTGFKGLEGFCGPMGLPGQADVLYRNRGDGFEDVSTATGVGRQQLPGLGVVFADLDDDGDQDIYVANDSEPNLLWRNDGDWRLRESAPLAGVAYSEEGRSQAGMGVDVGDFDNDGRSDIYVTNFSEDVNTLYRNEGGGLFADATAAAAFGGSVRPLLGWSTAFFDADNDGWRDLFVANGHLYPQLEIHPPGLRYPQPNQLYWNRSGRYELAEAAAHPGLGAARVSRGAAFGDHDNDGDVDILVMNLNDVPTFLLNEGGNTNAWIGLDLEGLGSNRDGIGARIRVTAGARTQVREVRRAYGYLSAHDGRVLFGLGHGERVEEVEIRWPSGRLQRLHDLAARRYYRVRESEVESVAAYGGAHGGMPGRSPAQPVPAGAPPATQVSMPPAPQLSASAAENYRRAVEFHDAARYREAVPLLRAALRQRPDHVEAAYALAVVLFSGMGEAAMAAAVLDTVARRDSSAAQLYHLLGAIRLSLDDAPGAISALERSAALAPAEWQVHNRLGVAHMRQGQINAALGAFQKAVAAAPYAPAPYGHIARIYDRQGRSEWARQARRQFERWRPLMDRLDRYLEGLRELPNDAELHFLVGRAYLMQGRKVLSQASFERALALRPDYALAHYGLAGVHHQHRELGEAIARYERAWELDSTLVTALNDLGRAYEQAGRSAEAVAVLEEAVERQPDLARAHLNLGRSYLKLGRRERATAALEMAVRLDSSLRPARKTLEELRGDR